MDIYTYIKRDHLRVAELIDNLLEINLPAVQAEVFSNIRVELTRHALAEEQTFYRALETASRDAGQGAFLAHAHADHQEMKVLLENLSVGAMAGPKWFEAFGELKHAIEHHVREEETEIFDRARALLSPAVAQRLATEMDAVKARILVPPTPEAASLRH